MSHPQAPDLRYRLLSMLLFFFWIAHAVWHGIKYRQSNYLWLRSGFCTDRSTNAIWVHASSVGEVELVKPLVEKLSYQHPVMLTTFTASGFQHAQRIMPETVIIQVLPIDFFPVSKAFIRRHRFKLALIAETELWPETLYQLKTLAIPLLQINARLSAKSHNASPWIKSILQKTLGYFDLHLTRTEQDMQRLKQMLVKQDRIQVVGNLKYAQTGADEEHEDLIGRPYILFASTHPGEEEIFASLLDSLDTTELMVIAPRHPQRAAEILKTLKMAGPDVQQRSVTKIINDDTRLYLADTLGELKALMAHATLVVMGGSFVDIGGHNVLEPARLGCTIITGPFDDNIRQDLDFLLENKAIIQVENRQQLADQLSSLLTNPQQRGTLATNARSAISKQAHVLDNYLQTISKYL